MSSRLGFRDTKCQGPKKKPLRFSRGFCVGESCRLLNDFDKNDHETDLESRYRLRRLLVDAFNRVPQNKTHEWGGERKV